MMDILILGRSLAALTAAWLLCEKGIRPIICGISLRSTRRIALNASTVELIESLFGIHLTANESARWIHRRSMIGWGDEQEAPREWPSLAIEANELTADIERTLLQRVGDQVAFATAAPAQDQAMVIDTIGPHHPCYRNLTGRLTFGRRAATACTLRTTRPFDEVLVERTADSWLILLPATMDCGTLYVVTAAQEPDPEDSIVKAIECSSLRGEVADRTPAQPWHLVAPVLHYPLATRHCIRAGEAAFTFDPLCGDGAGYAIRSGVLASTVAADVLRKELRGLDYYQFRLNRAFRAHLEACLECYAGWNTPDWRHEVDSMSRGVTFLTETMPREQLAAPAPSSWAI
jgi:hypothetical protein